MITCVSWRGMASAPPRRTPPETLSVLLGVNIDHVATLRQARHTAYPDPLEAARAARLGGADLITAHLREDRRHVQDMDIPRLAAEQPLPLNLELAVTPEMLALAVAWRPPCCCLVPERRAELTTEGGLDLLGGGALVGKGCERLRKAGIRVSLFIDPVPKQLQAAAALGAPVVELHTGRYAEAKSPQAREHELKRLREAAEQAAALGLQINAGHGLHAAILRPVAALPRLAELHIGHAIVARALFVGMRQAVAEIKEKLAEAPF